MITVHARVLLFALTAPAAAAVCQAVEGQPPFCGSKEKHQVVRQNTVPEPLPAGKARVFVFWRGMGWRWKGAQCKVALNGAWVAVLSSNTYSAIDVEPGKLRFCSAGRVLGTYLAPTWTSLLFLHATEGETYYIECSPGGDNAGAGEPTLSEPEPATGAKAVSKLRRVTFQPQPER